MIEVIIVDGSKEVLIELLKKTIKLLLYSLKLSFKYDQIVSNL